MNSTHLSSMTLAMASPGGDGKSGGPTGSAFDVFLPLGITVLIVYFLMLRPQQKRADTHKKLVEGLKRGDYVLANAGFYGRVTEVEGKTITVEVAPNVKIKMLRDAVATIDRPDAGDPKPA